MRIVELSSSFFAEVEGREKIVKLFFRDLRDLTSYKQVDWIEGETEGVQDLSLFRVSCSPQSFFPQDGNLNLLENILYTKQRVAVLNVHWSELIWGVIVKRRINTMSIQKGCVLCSAFWWWAFYQFSMSHLPCMCIRIQPFMLTFCFKLLIALSLFISFDDVRSAFVTKT